MSDLASTYAIPPELMQFVDSGFLEVLVEEPEKATVRFDIPSKQFTDSKGRMTCYTLFWIHPEKNAEHCWYYHETPGDLPNFWVSIEREGRRVGGRPGDHGRPR